MPYLSLPEAAQYVTRKSGVQVEPAAMLRMGVLGHLLIVAYFDGLMRDLNANRNEDFCGHLIVPPRHLATIENEGRTKITAAISLDAKSIYSPQTVRTAEQLRVLVTELDRIIPLMVELPTHVPLLRDVTAEVLEDLPSAKAQPKSTLQDEAILNWLASNNYDAQNLPMRANGKAGVKALVSNEMLKARSLFSEKSFKIAWERLRRNGEIRGAD